MLIFYLAVLITGSYWVVKTLLPEMSKPSPSSPKIVPIKKAVLKSNAPESAPTNDPYKRLEKLETLLAEKNKNIQLLQTELTIFIVQVREFDKLKNLLEEEIHRLREQNRIFRSELGLPATQPKEGAPI